MRNVIEVSTAIPKTGWMARTRKMIGTTMIVVAGTFGVAGTAVAADWVAMLLPENVNPRWESQDARFFVESMAEVAPGIRVEVFNANNDPATQQRQAEQALTRGAAVLVVIPIDGDSSAIIADSAAEAGVPTIAYDRMIHSKNTSFWVQADLEGMGSDQAQHVVDNTEDGDVLVLLKGSPTDPNAAVIHNGQLRVLQPLFDSGKRVLGSENWTQGWDPAIARRSMDQALIQLNNNVQGVVSSNDGNAGAAIAALAEQGLAGDVPVSGLDATVQALQLTPFDDHAAVLTHANDTDAGLTAYVFTSDAGLAEQCAATLEFGEIQINGVKYGIDLPHGGIKQSGIGHDCSHLALHDYLAVKRISRARTG